MNYRSINGHKREVPHSHLIHGLLPIIFTTIIILDSLVFNWTTVLTEFIPLWLRLSFLVFFLSIGLILIISSHKVLFHDNGPSETPITNGILKRVRNPMYLGILMIYIAFMLFSLSLISIGFFVIVVILYNRMVNFEEKILERLFGDQFLEYKSNVPKWIPNLI
jgi:protein-S-isoprenylcysteine O-methyltransferase Ste14